MASMLISFRQVAATASKGGRPFSRITKISVILSIFPRVREYCPLFNCHRTGVHVTLRPVNRYFPRVEDIVRIEDSLDASSAPPARHQNQRKEGLLDQPMPCSPERTPPLALACVSSSRTRSILSRHSSGGTGPSSSVYRLHDMGVDVAVGRVAERRQPDSVLLGDLPDARTCRDLGARDADIQDLDRQDLRAS